MATATATCASPSPPAREPEPPRTAEPVGGDASPPPPPPPPSTDPPPIVAAARPPLARRVPAGAGARSRPGGVAQPRRRAPSAADDSDSSAGGARAGATAAAVTGLSRADALREFLACVADEMRALVAAFHALPDEQHRFGDFKALWLARRLSALFHVEFWDSTPTDTHHTVLQVTLDLLVTAVGDAFEDGEAAVHVASVLGHVFALYCAYCVQVSEPKIKIAVSPSAWQALTQLSGLLMRQLALSSHRGGAREALAMLRRLEHEGGAFLKCLGGSVGELCLSDDHALPRRSAVVPNDATVVPERCDEEKEDLVMRLEALSVQYNTALKALSQVDANGDNPPNATAASSVRGGGASTGRGRAAPSFLRKRRPAIRNDLDDKNELGVLAAGLWSDTRDTMSDSWITRLRKSVILKEDKDSSESGEEGMRDQLENMIRGHSTREPLIHDDELANDMDAALMALEEELVREDTAENIQQSELIATQPTDRRSPRRNVRSQPEPRRLLSFQAEPCLTRPIRALSIASSIDTSNEIDELEAEQMDDLSSPSQVPTLERHRASITTNLALTRAPTRLSVTSSDQDSDGLDELEAELVGNVSGAKPAQRAPSAAPAPATQRAPAVQRTPVAQRAQPAQTSRKSSAVSRKQLGPGLATRRMSVASSDQESDGLDELEAELVGNVSGAKPAQRAPSAAPSPAAQRALAVQRTPVAQRAQPAQTSRKSSAVSRKPLGPGLATRRMSVASSDQESDGLDELEAELGAITDKPQSRRRISAMVMARKTTVDLRSASEVTAKRPHAVRESVPRQRAMSVASSAYESDGLEDLEAELEKDMSMASRHAAPAVVEAKRLAKTAKPESVMRRRQRAPSAVLIGGESDGLSDLEAELRRGDNQGSTQQIVTSELLATAGVTRMTRSRTSSFASGGQQSDGLEDLDRELQQELETSVQPRQATSLGIKRVTASSRKRPAVDPLSSEARPRKQPAPVATAKASPPPALRRSRRLSVASSARTETDTELAALEAELAMGSTPENLPVRERQTALLPAVQPTAPPRRPRAFSVSSAATETDEELMLLEAELAAGAGNLTPTPVLNSRAMSKAKAPAKPRIRQPRKVSEPKPPAVKKKAPPKPRKPRQTKPGTIPAQSSVSVERHLLTETAAMPARQADRGLSLRSQASSYDSDGLDELENELRVFQ